MASPTFTTQDPIGRPVQIPATVDENPSPRFSMGDTEAIAAYYAQHGYVVIKDVVPFVLCDRANITFEREVKHDERAFYRLSGMPETHEWTEKGFMQDGIRDVQSLNRRRYPSFRQASLDVVCHRNVQGVVEAVLGTPGKIVQTMYFEGNPATQPHQDSYYLDAEHIGSMVAAWIACEDIEPGAGRFYVCPGSHTLDLPHNEGEFNIAEHHDRYLDTITRTMRDEPLEVRAPALRTGDVLLWSARTIHGSLETDTPENTRRSFTAHFIPRADRFLQWHHHVVPLNLDRVNGIEVHHPKDQNTVRNRLRYVAETRMPGATAKAKRVVSARLLRRR